MVVAEQTETVTSGQVTTVNFEQNPASDLVAVAAR